MDSHKKPRVYLAGPMNGNKFKDIAGWRNQAALALNEAGIDCYSPLRDKPYLDDGKAIAFDKYKTAFNTADFILGRDYNDVINADVVIANFSGVTAPSLGTAMEIAWAYQLHKPCILVGETNNPNCRHPMIASACKFRAMDIEEALQICLTILLP